MKRKNKILVTMKALTLAAAVAVVVVSPSCRKETVGGAAGNVADGVRVITVQFDNSTKASLNGVKPTFTNNDKIRVSNSEKSEECTVTVSGPSAKITTTLSGELTAIYPADAAVLASETTDAPIASFNNFKVPAIQTGKVEDAIIAVATIASKSAIFTGVTALFEITPPSGATSITITSLNKIDAITGRRSTTANAAFINTTGADNAAKREITVNVTGGKAYAALVPGVNLTDLSFDAGENIGLKGIPTSILGTRPDKTAIKAKYTIDGTNWHPYVKIQMTINGDSKTYKWATMNIGATSLSDGGKYFSWGDVTGQTPSSSTFSTSFDWAHAPFNNGQSTFDSSYFSSVMNSECPDEILALKNDAANANWGGSWRMPTDMEFQKLILMPISPSSGPYFGNSETNKIFLPAAGWGEGTNLVSAGELGRCWSSKLDPASRDQARMYHVSAGGGGGFFSTSRHLGYPVRPVSD